RVTFVQAFNDRVAQRLNRRHNKNAACLRELRNQLSVREDVLDFCGEIKSYFRKLCVHPAGDAKRMPGSIQKIRIAKRDVPRARSYEPANVFKNNLLRYYEESSVVHWWDRAMRTDMQTPAARFDVTHKTLLAVALELLVML